MNRRSPIGIFIKNDREEKIDVKLMKYVRYVFGQIFNRSGFGWFADSSYVQPKWLTEPKSMSLS